MSLAFLILWYIFLIAFPITSLVLRIIESFTNTLRQIETYILLASLIYGGYMLIFVLCKKEDKDSKRESLINNNSIDLFRDHWYKYLFCLSVGTIFLPKLILNLETNFSTYSGKNSKVIVDLVFAQIVVPVMVLCDSFMIPRRRVPSPICDLLILLAIAVAFFIIDLSNSWSLFIVYFGNLLTNIIFSFNGYVLYDYILYKKVGDGKGFSLFNR